MSVAVKHLPTGAKIKMPPKRPNQKPKPSRAGRVQISAWIDPERREKLRIIARGTQMSMETLIEQALDHVFAQYMDDGDE